MQRAPVAALLALLAAAPAVAQDRGWTGTILEEDDFWAPQNHDEYYTHGIRLSLTSGDVQDPFWLAPFNWLSGLTPAFPDVATASRRYNIIPVGQNMYTPRNWRLVNPDPRDRPYAGWLYGGVGLMQDTPGTNSDPVDRFDELALKLGIVGPGSLANATQTHYHLLIRVEPFAGWHAQIRNEPAFDLFYQRKWRYYAETASGWGWDAIPQWDLRVGTVYDYAGAGGMLRLGRNLRVDYGPPHIDLNLGADYINPTRAAPKTLGFYTFIGAEARAVAHNIFLDGNDFKSSAQVSKIPAVGDLEAGVAFTYRHYRLAYTYVLRSPEFAHQAGPDHYGSLNLTVHLPF
ncbi:MAG TPA: lipid A deacylase LpxR family protein [Stellaceae bacterium]|nr:lipid A deacylase LpxR family protein [Stellaceae bacterium]